MFNILNHENHQGLIQQRNERGNDKCRGKHCRLFNSYYPIPCYCSPEKGFSNVKEIFVKELFVFNPISEWGAHCAPPTKNRFNPNI